MDFRQLEAFVNTVENQSFSAAAERLHLSQPTVSAHIRSLEQELNAQLIRRTTKKFEVTEDGRRLYAYAVNILRLQKKAADEFSETGRRELHIGASSVPGQCLLPQLLGEYHRRFPEVRFRTFHSDSLDIIDKVACGSLDAGLVGTAPEGGCTFVPIASDELVIAAPNNEHFRQMQKDGAPLEKLLREPMLMRTDQSGTKRETERFFARLGIPEEELNVVASMNDAEALRSCVAQGLGISVISRRLAEPLERQGLVLEFPLGGERLVRRLYLVYVENRYLPKTAAEFIRFLKSRPQDELA